MTHGTDAAWRRTASPAEPDAEANRGHAVTRHGGAGTAAVSAHRARPPGDAAVSSAAATVAAELQDISRGGCFFKSTEIVPLDRRISVVLSANGGKTCQASGRVVRTVAYKGFAVLFDQDDGGAIEDFIRELTPLPLESRAALLSSVLKPEIEIY